MTDHALALWAVWIAGVTAVIAGIGVFVTYVGLRYMAEQVRLMRQEQRARLMADATLVSTSDGPKLIGGVLGRFLKGAAGRLYGR